MTFCSWTSHSADEPGLFTRKGRYHVQSVMTMMTMTMPAAAEAAFQRLKHLQLSTLFRSSVTNH